MMEATGCEKARSRRRPRAAGRRRKRTREKRELEARLEEMRFELDVLNATIDEIKKCEGVNEALRKAQGKDSDCSPP